MTPAVFLREFYLAGRPLVLRGAARRVHRDSPILTQAQLLTLTLSLTLTLNLSLTLTQTHTHILSLRRTLPTLTLTLPQLPTVVLSRTLTLTLSLTLTRTQTHIQSLRRTLPRSPPVVPAAGPRGASGHAKRSPLSTPTFGSRPRRCRTPNRLAGRSSRASDSGRS